MFMVKYADFHSRGVPLSFTQVSLEYLVTNIRSTRLHWFLSHLKCSVHLWIILACLVANFVACIFLNLFMLQRGVRYVTSII